MNADTATATATANVIAANTNIIKKDFVAELHRLTNSSPINNGF